jgi:SAM-dependent methyltransferase
MARQNGRTRSGARQRGRGKASWPLSRGADRHHPSADVRFFRRVFRAEFDRPPTVLREDFCGTGYLSCTWASASREHVAFGLDIDPEPLAWGEAHNRAELSASVMERVELIEGNALDVLPRKADIVCALNFSWFCFHTRPELLRYFRAARANLRSEGLFVLDIEGGPEVQTVLEERRRVGRFTYIWDQASFDGIGNRTLCHIHFRFRDGSELRRAFTYDWRLWSMPEVRDLLLEAGFDRVDAYWEGDDGKGSGNGVFTRRERAENSEAWIAYVVAVKGSR